MTALDNAVVGQVQALGERHEMISNGGSPMLAERVRAIETSYNGYRFRSRLEARWAVFFDHLNIKYEYEKEGFELEAAGRYLPDFWLPAYGSWIEIKGARPEEDEEAKAAELAKLTESDVFIFWGSIPMPRPDYGDMGSNDDSAYKHFGGPAGGWDNNYRWCICPTCGLLGLEFDGRSDRLPCKSCWLCQDLMHGKRHTSTANGTCPHHGMDLKIGCPVSDHGDKGYTFDHPTLLAAYTAARQARFEYGENGTRKR